MWIWNVPFYNYGESLKKGKKKLLTKLERNIYDN